MARKLRVEKVGFYHVLNRGVARSNIYLCDDDFVKFLKIMQEASDEYDFKVDSFCLMSNHYHLLLEINKENLSIIMQKINSRYSIYFNKKYKRVGPLWQGRFKSWYVYDEKYLHALIRYIEFNPIKAHITQKVGEYKWAMSSGDFSYLMLNFKLLQNIDFTKELDEKELQKIDELYHTKIEVKNDNITPKEMIPLSDYFTKYPKEQAIYNAIKDGYTGNAIAKHLTLSPVSISKILKNYREKVKLFNKLKDKNIFWSYSKSIAYDIAGENLTIEYLFKYGDFDEIQQGFKLFGKRVMKRVWEDKLKSDKRFIKLNFMIARVFFDMNVEASYFKEIKNARFEKLKLLAS